jgi:hypothetical protein
MAITTVLPEHHSPNRSGFRASVGEKCSTGSTVGEAIDRLTSEHGIPIETSLVVVQPQVADSFFPLEQQQRLMELMDRWRLARDSGSELSEPEQTERNALIQTELQATTMRATS